MYIDLIVLIVLILLVIMFFRQFSSFVYFIAIADIFLRILTFIGENIPLADVSAVINKYIIGSYTSGLLYTILAWVFVVIMIIFESYIIKFFIKKKKV